MARINARAKGASGEREFCDWLLHHFDIEIEDKPERNLEQVRSGGADIIYPPFAFEIKRVEELAHGKWWAQVNTAIKDKKGPAFGLEPVVAFRQNRKEWEFLIGAWHIGAPHGFVHVNDMVWRHWARKFIDSIKQEKIISIEEKSFLLSRQAS